MITSRTDIVKLATTLLVALLGLCAAGNQVYAGLGDELFKLTASDAAQFNSFGHSVAMSGNWAIVGPLRNDSEGLLAGSAYVYNVATGQEVWRLTAGDAAPLDNFGHSVAASGRLAIIGAPGDDDNCIEPGCNTGSAYLFDMLSGQQRFKFRAPDPSENQEFGFSVALSGQRALIGAFQDDNPAISDVLYNSGAAYLFDVDTGAQLMKLKADDEARRDHFGRAVALSDNIALIGAPSTDEAGDMSGSAYLFDAVSGQQLRKLTASDAAAGDNFGQAVGVNGNLAVIGAPGDDDAGGRSGAAYVFDVTTGRELFKLTAEDASSLDQFGQSVGISGNLITVGAPLHGDVSSFQGSVYLFDATTGRQLFKFTATDADQFDQFGQSVAISGTMALFGSSGDDDACGGATICDAGSAFIFDLGMPIFGDTNGDGRVDLNDLNAVRNHFGGQGPADGTLGGDAYPFDGFVNVNDLNAVRDHFHSTVSSVPEPSALLLAALGGLAVLAVRRHRHD